MDIKHDPLSIAENKPAEPDPPVKLTRTARLPIGREEILKASQILKEYKTGKSNLEKRIIENEQWYKLRHWECMTNSKDSQVKPVSAQLFNSIANKHADAMDNFPSPNILPREENDKFEAKSLTSIIPVILDQCEFEQTYSDVWNYKLKSGTGVYGVFWDSTKLNGLGDIAIKKVDLLNLFWQSGITDIQESRNIFHVELWDNDVLAERYPQLKDKLGGESDEVSKYYYDDTVKTDDKTAVVDWYYKKYQNGKRVLHYCKFARDEVLYATENETNPIIGENGEIIKNPLAETGWYDHGQYPFVFDPLFSVEGTPAGFGYIDVGKSAQEYIDRINQAIMKNTLASAGPRYLSKEGSGINEKEFMDMTKDVVHYEGQPDAITPIVGKPLNSIYVQVLNNKIEELKEVTGNRDASTGGSGGVTAASALAAMQEAGSKLSRDNIKAAYRAYRKIIVMVIELIRQFYDTQRSFRITGQRGESEFIEYSNRGIARQPQGTPFGVDMGYRVPYFDIEVTAQKASPYSKLAQNEMALQFFGAGFFNPQLTDQALACLDMMDFDRKDFVEQKIAENGTLYQKYMMLQQQALALGAMVDQAKGTNEITAGLMQQFGMTTPGFTAGRIPSADIEEKEALGGESSESSTTKKARQRVADSTSPN